MTGTMDRLSHMFRAVQSAAPQDPHELEAPGGRAGRRLPMQAATEVVWSLLPPVSFADDQVAISAILEPCYEVGGDVFDYSVNPGLVQVALFDAVGHGMAASLLSTLAVNAY